MEVKAQPGLSEVWGRRRSTAESRNFVVSGNRHGKHLERAVPVPLPMLGCFFCFGLFHRCRVLCSLLQRFCIWRANNNRKNLFSFSWLISSTVLAGSWHSSVLLDLPLMHPWKQILLLGNHMKLSVHVCCLLGREWLSTTSVSKEILPEMSALVQAWQPLMLISGKDQPQIPGIFRFTEDNGTWYSEEVNLHSADLWRALRLSWMDLHWDEV